MDEDTEHAQLAQQQMEEYQQILANDPGYFEWINKTEKVRINEIQRESIERF